MREVKTDDGPTIPVRMNKRTTVTTLRHMNGDHLLGLRDVRRSENGAYVRCHNGAAEDNKRIQVNVFFKDQRWQLEKIKRVQRQFYKRLVKVHRDKRKCQREEHKQKQEEMRKDLQNIRLRRLIKRVVDRFRENVKRKKAERTRKRFAIAGGMRSYTGDGGVNKHGIFGVKSQAASTDSVTRMVKLAAKKKNLQREGVIPTENPEFVKSLKPPNTLNETKKVVNESSDKLETQSVQSIRDDGKNESNTSQMSPKINSTNIEKQLDGKGVSKVGNLQMQEGERSETRGVPPPVDGRFGGTSPSVKSGDMVLTRKTAQNREHVEGNYLPITKQSGKRSANKGQVGVLPSPRGRLTVENLAVHELSQQEDERASHERHKSIEHRTPVKTTVIQVTKSDAPKSTVRIAPESSLTDLKNISEVPRLEPNDQNSTQTEQMKHTGQLGALHIPRRATLRPPPKAFLLKIDEVDAVKEANASLEEGANGGIHKEQSVPLSRIIRLERKAEKAERLRELNEELVPHYKRNQKGELKVQMVPFIRASFIPPSNKIRYQQEKLKKEEKLNMARQRVRIRNFVHHCPVAENVPVRVFQNAKSEPSHITADVNTSLNQASLATLMFNVYHKELPPEGVDPNSVEALKKCRYIRSFDIVKTKKLREDVFRKPSTSWDNPTMTQQEKRHQLLMQRQRAVNR